MSSLSLIRNNHNYITIRNSEGDLIYTFLDHGSYSTTNHCIDKNTYVIQFIEFRDNIKPGWKYIEVDKIANLGEIQIKARYVVESCNISELTDPRYTEDCKFPHIRDSLIDLFNKKI